MRQFPIEREAVINGSHAYIIDSDKLENSDLNRFIREKQIGIIIYNSQENIFNSNHQFSGRLVDIAGIPDQENEQQLRSSTNSIKEFFTSSRSLAGGNANYTNILFLLKKLDQNYLQLFALYVDQMNFENTERIGEISDVYKRLLQQWNDVEKKLNDFIQKRSQSTNPNTSYPDPEESIILDYKDWFGQKPEIQPLQMQGSQISNNLVISQVEMRQQLKQKYEDAFQLPPPINIPKFQRRSLK